MEETSPNSVPQPHHFPQQQHHHQQLQQQFQQQQQRLLQQQQLFLMQQQQQQQQQHQQHYQQQQQQQQQQQGQQQQLQQQQQNQQQQQMQRQFNLQQQQAAMSRFPSNIDAHLRAPGLRSLQFQESQHHPSPPAPPPPPPPTSSPSPSQSSSSSKQQPQHLQPSQSQRLQLQGKTVGVGAGRVAPPPPVVNPVEMEMVQEDALKVCNPDVKRPFTSVEDAVFRLLPYHVVADYEAEEDDRILDSDTTGRVQSRLQQWDHNILTRIADFTNTFEKQVLAFNIMTRKRACGEFWSEERLMIEQALMQEERQALLEVRAELETREKANREAAEVKMRMAMVQAEHARAEAQSHPEIIIRPPIRSNAAASHGDDGSHDLVQEQGNMAEIQAWGNAQRDDEEPSEDFLNDENENGDAGMQDEWRESAELDLNTR